MKIMMTGATGLIGSELAKKLTASGHSLVVVTRDRVKAQDRLGFNAEFIEHDLNSVALKAEDFKDIEVVINLAGESINGYWTRKKKT